MSAIESCRLLLDGPNAPTFEECTSKELDLNFIKTVAACELPITVEFSMKVSGPLASELRTALGAGMSISRSFEARKALLKALGESLIKGWFGVIFKVYAELSNPLERNDQCDTSS